MKRRGFLQTLAGLAGLTVAPIVPAKQKELLPPVNVRDAVTKVSPFPGPFGHLTIDDFGAKNTKCLSVDSLCQNGYVTKSYIDRMVTGIDWKPPAALFPSEALVGDAFLFEPKTYRTLPLDRITIERLEGCYIYSESGWRQLLGLARTDSFNHNSPTKIDGELSKINSVPFDKHTHSSV